MPPANQLLGPLTYGDAVPDDLENVAAAAAGGDREAFAELIARTQTDIWRFTAYLVDRQAADDLTQETYLRAFRSLSRFRSEAPILTWLLTIARRVCIAEIDRRSRALEAQLLPAAEPSVPDHSARTELEVVLDSLEPQRRLAFVLTQVIGCDYAEAAVICQCAIGTIRSRVARARNDLVVALRPEEHRATS